MVRHNIVAKSKATDLHTPKQVLLKQHAPLAVFASVLCHVCVECHFCSWLVELWFSAVPFQQALAHVPGVCVAAFFSVPALIYQPPLQGSSFLDTPCQFWMSPFNF